MKWTMMAVAAISLAALTTPANAALRVLFTGTIDSSSPNPLAGEDGYQNIPLAADTLSVSFRISDSYLVDIGGGTSIAGVYHDPDGSMTIDAAPFAYDKYSDVLDGGGIVYDSYEWCGADPAACERPQVLISTPFLTFQDGALVGFSLYSEPGVGLPIAPLISGEGTSFTMGTGFYGGALYGGPEYTGHWNFADAVILSVVPEPAAWLTMIAGFGLTGLALRRRTTRRILA